MPDDALVDAVSQLSFAVTAELSAVAAAHDLSLTQLRLLGVLRDREPRMSALAAHLGLDRSTVSGLVDRAAARGLVERYADPDDRRASRVRLTRAGHDLAAAGASALTERLDRALPGAAGLARADRDRLVRLVGRLLSP